MPRAPLTMRYAFFYHDDVIEWKHFPRNWPFVRGIHRSPVTSPHKGQWSGALIFYLTCVWINGWVNNHEAGDLRRYRAHYDVIVMIHWRPGVVTAPASSSSVVVMITHGATGGDGVGLVVPLGFQCLFLPTTRKLHFFYIYVIISILGIIDISREISIYAYWVLHDLHF